MRVGKLLGAFDHRFDFPENWEFVILHGPNGIGKTKLLELTHAILRGELARVHTIPFITMVMNFSGGSTLHVQRTKRSQGPHRKSPKRSNVSYKDDLHGTHLVFRYSEGEGEVKRWTEPILRDPAHDAPFASHREMLMLENWMLQQQRDSSSIEPWLMREFLRLSHGRYRDEDRHPVYKRLIEDVNIHLIETQRLLDLTPFPSKPDGEKIGSRSKSRAESYSADIARRIKEVLAQSSPVSQELDRTFPARVLTGDDQPEPPDDAEIREEYFRQARLRERLAQIDLLEEAPEPPIPEVLLPWQRRVLWTYLLDSSLKLDQFEDFLAKLELLIEIVNSRFLHKYLRIDREKGFVFETAQGEEVRPEQLSSGEQHELVLVYDLLFRVQAGSLVLIDEPEISLHVSWQREFLNDIVRVARLTSLRFVVATHSPQIAHKWIERTVPLLPSANDSEVEG
ncbi:AAA family ATPase [Micromonospora schwarzwaldensis]|uniref:AAA family ATPase n=1 Tax=Micromonospora sp. DSM 45708 TaxID=3111767 RepID=UPI0031D1722F